MRKICVLQHVASEPPGVIADVLKSQGFTIHTVRLHRREPVPRRIGHFAGVVVMGGPMGVYEQDRYPFLADEIRLLRDALSKQRPILGVCLGSQLLAAALGAPVTRGKQKEIGWHSVALSKAAGKDVLWRDLPKSFVAYHWHGYVFKLPRSATPLARSKLTNCQAFRYGDSAYGILFHLEVTEQIIRRMTKTFNDELQDAGIRTCQILDDMPKQLPTLQAMGRTVFERWATLTKGEHRRESNRLVIRVKRVYGSSSPDDGARFLVDRLWPRGVKKEDLRLDGWLKDAAPSDALRRWFHRGPATWPEFRQRYFAELDRQPKVTKPILDAASRGPVTLLFSAKSLDHNNAVALTEYCESQK